MYSNSFPSQTVSVKYDIFWARLNSCPHTNTILYLNFESFELNQGKNFFSKFYGKASIKSWFTSYSLRPSPSTYLEKKMVLTREKKRKVYKNNIVEYNYITKIVQISLCIFYGKNILQSTSSLKKIPICSNFNFFTRDLARASIEKLTFSSSSSINLVHLNTNPNWHACQM